MTEFFLSKISNKTFPVTEKVACISISPTIYALILTDNPALSREASISITEYIHYKQKYVEQFVLKEIGELSELENQVIDSIGKNKIINRQQDEDDKPLLLGQRLADNVASFGGSWSFIIFFGTFIFVWILLNILLFHNHGYDPYPFILLNLILSCLAALQAPVIMMSQNRREEKDRDRAKKDYLVNLKTELEIRILHEKIDYLLDIHNEQTSLLKNIADRKEA